MTEICYSREHWFDWGSGLCVVMAEVLYIVERLGKAE